MADREDRFLDEVCKNIKYRTVHKEIRAELRSHIRDVSEEYVKTGYSREQAVNTAIARMGSAEEIGKALNRQFCLPFNCRFGLSVWAALVTIAAYLLYPLLYKIHSGTIKIPCASVVIAAIILMFILINVMYLRRGRLKFSVKDIGGVTVGYFIGWTIVQSGLLLASRIVGEYGFYPYMQDVKILFGFPYIPLVLKELSAFAMEYFCLWLCIIIYISAIKSAKMRKSGFIFAARFSGGYFSYVDVDDSFYGQRSADK